MLAISIALFLLLNIRATFQATVCPSGWSNVDSDADTGKTRCIKVLDWEVHYEQARSFCKAFGTLETGLADLVSIRSNAQNDALYNLARQAVANPAAVWIGLQSESGAPTKWSDGESTSAYTNYLSGTVFTKPSCFSMDTSTTTKQKKWTNEVACTGTAFFACEITVGFPTDCSGYLGEEPGLKMIQLSDDTVVEMYCEDELTIIQSRGEADTTSFDVSYELYEEPIGSPGRYNNFWLGLKNMHLLIGDSGNFKLVIQLCCGNTAGLTMYYNNVKVSAKSSGYVLDGKKVSDDDDYGLDFANYRTDLGSKFSTYHTFDEGVKYCDVISNSYWGGAVEEGPGGFWIGSCANNLNGYYYPYKSSFFSDPLHCVLDEKKMGPHGTGIEIRTNWTYENFGASGENLFDSISWTRARMAVYRMSQTPKLRKYCDDFVV